MYNRHDVSLRDMASPCRTSHHSPQVDYTVVDFLGTQLPGAKKQHDDRETQHIYI